MWAHPDCITLGRVTDGSNKKARERAGGMSPARSAPGCPPAADMVHATSSLLLLLLSLALLAPGHSAKKVTGWSWEWVPLGAHPCLLPGTESSYFIPVLADWGLDQRPGLQHDHRGCEQQGRVQWHLPHSCNSHIK